MNKKVILIALSAVMFSTVSFAQKVIKSGNAVIIDCSDMNPKFYLSKKIEPRTTTATNKTGPTNGAADISSEESNAKVYKKFEVHKTNNYDVIDWLGAVTLCANLNSNGTGWRLPTHREWVLIWLLKEKLFGNGVSPFGLDLFWSATQSSNGPYAARCFRDGIMRHEFKISVSGSSERVKVRCVRDL